MEQCILLIFSASIASSYFVLKIYYLHFKQDHKRTHSRNMKQKREKKKVFFSICAKNGRRRRKRNLTLVKLHSSFNAKEPNFFPKRRKEIIMFHVKYVQVEGIIIKFSCSSLSCIEPFHFIWNYVFIIISRISRLSLFNILQHLQPKIRTALIIHVCLR